MTEEYKFLNKTETHSTKVARMASVVCCFIILGIIYGVLSS